MPDAVDFTFNFLHPENVRMLSPWVIILGISVLALLLEDLALVAGIGLVHGMVISPLPIAIGLYVAIVAGDLFLYAAGRWLRQYKQHKKATPDHHLKKFAVNRFGYGFWGAIIIARALPAARLPAYMAAGYHAVSPLIFSIVIALTAFLWVGLSIYVGANALEWVEKSFGLSPIAIILPLIIFFFFNAALKFAKNYMNKRTTVQEESYNLPL